MYLVHTTLRRMGLVFNDNNLSGDGSINGCVSVSDRRGYIPVDKHMRVYSSMQWMTKEQITVVVWLKSPLWNRSYAYFYIMPHGVREVS